MSLSKAMKYSALRSVRFVRLWREKRKLDAVLAKRKAARTQFNAAHPRDREGRFAS